MRARRIAAVALAGLFLSGNAALAQTPPPVPPVTEADRQAAFPNVEGHAVHDQAINYFVLADQFEWQADGRTNGLKWDQSGWVGRDRDRLWFRSEGHVDEGRVGDADAHILYGRAFARWWEVVGGIRQDFRPGDAQTWAAFGVQGLAPYWFEVEATGYVGAGGRTAARVEVEYELLLTNRIVLQPRVEVNLFGKDDPARGIGAGVSDLDLGLRLRYEIRRELAPYAGLTWQRKLAGTADRARQEGHEVGGLRFVTGVRFWF